MLSSVESSRREALSGVLGPDQRVTEECAPEHTSDAANMFGEASDGWELIKLLRVELKTKPLLDLTC